MTLLTRAALRMDRLPWRRYWIRRGDSFDVENAGFLVEPGSMDPLFAARNASLSSLDDLDRVRCVLALGDPGLGKSRELEAYATRVHDRLKTASTSVDGRRDALLAFDLKEFDSREDVRQQVFEDPAFSAWREDETSILYLILDSLDESLIALAPFCEFLLEQLSGLPNTRLRLRIACRTAVVPPEFLRGIKAIFASVTNERESGSDGQQRNEDNMAGEIGAEDDSHVPAPTRSDEETITKWESLAVVEIVPLTRSNASLAAAAQLGSEETATRFLEVVEAADAGQFAARPQTLFALIRRYRSGEPLAASQIELYRDLAEHACDPDIIRPRSNDTRPTRKTRVERYRIAGRICAALLFGNRKAIALDPDDAREPGILDLRLLTGEERVGTTSLRVDEGALEEAVNTGLFTGREETRIAPHQTFAEFLAADWVVARQIPIGQLRSLLVDPLDPERKVVPQLRQVAAWLAAMRHDVFEDIARNEPEIVLWSDVVQVPVDQRAALVDALFQKATANRLDSPGGAVRKRFAHLAYDGLADQLRRVVNDGSLPERTRELALEIASACHVASVATAAVELVLDEATSAGLRVAAARVVASAGVETDRRRLIPLALAPLPFDVGDDLKGAVLSACHPLLEPAELFRALTRPKRPNWGGSYAIASHEIERTLGPRHVDAGCVWLRDCNHMTSAMQHVAIRVLLLALDRLSEESVRGALAAYVWAQLDRHDNFLRLDERENSEVRDILRREPEKRRQLLSAVISQTQPGNHGLYWSEREMPDLFLADDVPWALRELSVLPAGVPQREGWRDILLMRFDYGSRAHLEAAFAHGDDPDVLAVSSRIAADYETVDDALVAVQRAREAQTRNEAENSGISTRRPRERQLLGPLQSLEARLETAVSQNRPAAECWRQVIWELHRAPDGSEKFHLGTANEFERLADGVLVSRLADAAEHYLVHAEVSEKPFPEGQMLRSVIFGIHAGAALYYFGPERLWDLDGAVWVKWARSFAGYFPVSGEEEIHSALLTVGEANAPEAMDSELAGVIDQYGNSVGRGLPESTFNVAMENPTLVDALYNSLVGGRCGVDQEFDLLGRLATARVLDGRRAAMAIMSRYRSRRTDTDEAVRRIGAAAVLLVCVPELSWQDLWPILSVDDAFARDVLLRAAALHEYYPARAVARLTDDQVADLFLVVARCFPSENDPWHTGVFSPGARDNIGNWRDGLLRHLENANTESSVAALLRVAEAAPVQDYRVRVWLRAAAARRGDRWRGVAPTELVGIADSARLRLVDSGAQLLDLIAESLDRLERDFQGELRSVVGLWNEQERGGYTPKAESHLANEVARHLRHDLGERGVVIGRELILQVGIVGGAAGLRTDIDVVANAISESDRAMKQVRAVIEVKGSWNRALMTALNGQLVQQYMEPHCIRYGLYLVGDFTCDVWKPSSQKSQSAALGGRSVLGARLTSQAEAATNGIREVRARVLDASLSAEPPQRVPLVQSRKKRRSGLVRRKSTAKEMEKSSLKTTKR